MKALLDTDIIIQREINKTISRDIEILYKWLDRTRYSKCIHSITINYIKGGSDKQLANALLNKLDCYEVINNEFSPLQDEMKKISTDIDKTENDKSNSILLNEILTRRVEIFITENKKNHQKAELLGIQDKVFTIDSFLEKVFSEYPDFIDYKVLNVQKLKFKYINLADSFFDSLKNDYAEFNEWFIKKHNEEAYITINSNNGMLLSFLYLKIERENENYTNIIPQFTPKKRLKIGTFKVINNGFRLGERFMKIIFDNALKNKVNEIYVTIFDEREDQKRLIDLLEVWGFTFWGMKDKERVYVRNFTPHFNIQSLKQCYPYISKNQNCYIVPIYPDYHTELLPDSILNTESPAEFIEDFPHRNGINKVYVSRALEPHPQTGDILIFYRTGGYYKSVITTIGIVTESRSNFKDEEDFILYCRKSSVYPENKLKEMWRYSTKKPFAIRFLYIYSFPHRLNMKKLIDLRILSGINDAPRGFKSITQQQFETILTATKSDDSFIIN